VGNAFPRFGAGAAGAAEEAEADSEMEEERRKDRRLRIMGGVGPGTDGVGVTLDASPEKLRNKDERALTPKRGKNW